MTFNRPLALVLLTLVALTGCETIPLHAQTSGAAAPASMITPMVEKRETLVATGYAVISVQNHKNPAQQRLLAIRASKLDAYRSLTEQVYGQQLDKYNAQVAESNNRNQALSQLALALGMYLG
jgi:hypothetical protein